MIFERLKNKNKQLKAGDIVITVSGTSMLIKDNGKYCLLSLKTGVKKSNWYDSIEKLQDNIEIKDAVKNSNVKLVEIEGGK